MKCQQSEIGRPGRRLGQGSGWAKTRQGLEREVQAQEELRARRPVVKVAPVAWERSGLDGSALHNDREGLGESMQSQCLSNIQGDVQGVDCLVI